MFISVSRSGKDGKNSYVNLMETYRDADGKKRTRLVESYGKLDDLLADDPEALNKLKAECAAGRKCQKEEKSSLQKIKFQKLLESATDKANKTTSTVLNYSYYCFRNIWNLYFTLDRKINYIQKTRFKCTYTINDAILYLVMHKILNPDSIQSSFVDKDNFLGDPIKNISLDQLYDTYTFVDTYKDDIFKYVNKNLDKKLGSDRATLIFYDVTNVYFESQLTDRERNYEIPSFTDAVKNKAISELEQKRLEPTCFDDDGYLISEKLPQWFWDEITSDEYQYLRMRGPSKEHRFDLPLVSIALVIDKYGYPLDFEIYPGNASEFKTMKKSIESLKAKYNISEAIVVADRGLNSLSNLQMLLENDLGFLVAQKVSQFNNEINEKMLDLSLYRPIDINKPDSGLYQVINDWKKTGSSSRNDIQCTLVLTYNEKRKKRDDAILDMWVDIIEQKKNLGVKIGQKKFGWASLAETESNTENLIIGVNKKSLDRKRKLCGFAAMVYKEPPKINSNHSIGLSDDRIACIYHHLNKIEECFKIMKSYLGLRPMFVRTYSHIRGHITICTLALLMIRILQEKLRANNIYISIKRLCKELKNFNVAAVMNNQYTSYILLNGNISYRKGYERKSTEEIISLIENGSITINYTAEIMRACGLTPLPSICDRTTLAACLGTRFKEDQDVIPSVHIRAKTIAT